MEQAHLATLFDEFPLLQTDRLNLRQVAAADAEDLFVVYSDPEVMKYYDSFPLTNTEQSAEIIMRWASRFKDRQAIRWGICHKGSPQVIGTLGIRLETEWKAALGYDLAPRFWSKGFMTEALHEAVDFLFERTGLIRLEALVMPGNSPSEAVLGRLGFEREGLLRRYAFFKEAHQDLQIFSILRSDWLEE